MKWVSDGYVTTKSKIKEVQLVVYLYQRWNRIPWAHRRRGSTKMRRGFIVVAQDPAQSEVCKMTSDQIIEIYAERLPVRAERGSRLEEAHLQYRIQQHCCRTESPEGDFMHKWKNWETGGMTVIATHAINDRG